MQRFLAARLARVGTGPWRPAASLSTLRQLAGPGEAGDIAHQACLLRWANSAAAGAKAAPRRPATSWMLFLSQYRKEHPEVTGKDVWPAASGAWQGLSEHQKALWMEKHAANRRTYDAQRAKAAAKATRKRDPERPKAPTTAYFRFLSEFRKRHPDEKKVTEIAKKAGAAWQLFAAPEKQPYVDAYAADREAHKLALGRYVQSGRASAWKLSISPRPRDPERPKAPTTAFFRFAADLRKKHPDTKRVTEFARMAGAEWRRLAVQEKQPYLDAYAADREAHKAALERYVRSGRAAAWKEAVCPPTRDPERPKLPTTAYFRFLQDFRKRHPDEKAVTELTKRAAAEWKLLPDGEKQPYLDAYAADREAHRLALQEYASSGKEAAWKARRSQALADRKGKAAKADAARSEAQAKQASAKGAAAATA